MIPVGSATCQVLIDVSGTPFGGGPTWTDITDYVMTSPLEDGASDITFSWGRQDWLGDATDSQFSLTLRNIDGRFTPGRSVLSDGVTANPFYPYVTFGTRVRVTETVASIVVYMADGYITDVTATPRNGTYWTAQINCTDILAARMGSTTPLRGWLVEEALVDDPAFLFPLQETEGATTFGDISGQTVPATVVTSKYGAGIVTAGQEAAGVLTSTSVTLTQPVWGGPGIPAAGSWLALPAPAFAAPFTVSVWMTFPATLPPLFQMVFYWQSALSSVGAGQIALGLVNSTGIFASATGAGGTSVSASSFTIPTDTDLHHVAVTLGTDQKTLKIFIDGVVVASTVSGSAIGTLGASSTAVCTVGMQTVGNVTSPPASPWAGSIAYVAAFPSDVGATRVLAHYNAGVNGFTGERTDTHVVRILGYRANTGYNVDTGIGLVGSGDITDSTEQAALLDAASAEGGLLYVDGQGQVTLLNRARNFNPAVDVTLNCANGEVDIPTTFNDDIQHVTNDVTVSRPDGADQRLTNAASIAQVGVVSTSLSANVDSDTHALDLAGWALAQGVRDQTSIPTLAINLYTLASTAQALNVLQLKPLDVVAVTNIPGVPPSTTMTVQVQGGTYTRSSERFDIELYCTPTPTPVGVWNSGPAWWDSTSVVWAY